MERPVHIFEISRFRRFRLLFHQPGRRKVAPLSLFLEATAVDRALPVVHSHFETLVRNESRQARPRPAVASSVPGSLSFAPPFGSIFPQGDLRSALGVRSKDCPP